MKSPQIEALPGMTPLGLAPGMMADIALKAATTIAEAAIAKAEGKL